jgi:hypothetical protein
LNAIRPVRRNPRNGWRWRSAVGNEHMICENSLK